MMKSFFKKLAFVMALAMVVTLAAPAGSAFAAETGVSVQGTKTIVTEYEFEKAGATFDFSFQGAPSDWKTTYEWTSSNEDVATVDTAGIVTAVAPGTAVITITAGADKSYVETVKITVKEPVEELTAAQKTAKTVQVTFTKDHDFDATGADTDGVNTVKVYRVFSTEEMAKMANKNGLKFDEEGNGYQAYYVMDVDVNYFENGEKDFTKWTITGYDWFVDGANYAVVYGPNETSSTIEGIIATFTAYVGKPASIKLSATQATVENEVESGIPAKISCKLYNAQGIDLTSYFANTYESADETYYEVLTEDVDVSVSGNEVSFGEIGSAEILGSYTFYDEDKEEDVTLTDKVTVFAGKYSTYAVESIYNWSLNDNNLWKSTTTSMIAGDTDQLYVIVKDNRGNYYSNLEGIEDMNYKIGGVKVLHVDNDAAPFAQYGYKLVFDSLDPDSLLVDPDGAVTSYKKTNSFAVVSYTRIDDESAKLYEIGVMGIEVTAPRKLNSVAYTEGTSFTVLSETEAEDGEPNVYFYYDDFNTTDTVKVELRNQYGKIWDDNAEDYYDADPNFTVTTTRSEFESVAAAFENALNNSENGSYRSWDFDASIFTGSSATSVSFKVKESETGNSTTVTIRLSQPKYEVVKDENGDIVKDEDGNVKQMVYVDPAKAVLETSGVELYSSLNTTAKLFQVSKASQKVGYVRVGTLEKDEDENRGYYLANKAISTSFTVNDKNSLESFVNIETASASALELGDYILVVTDPSGNIVPAVGNGTNRFAADGKSKLGLEANSDGCWYNFVVGAEYEVAEEYQTDETTAMEYAAVGTYRATVYKIYNIIPNKDGSVKYTLSRVSNDTFKIEKTFKDVTFYHQETTKDVEGVDIFDGKEDIYEAIRQTMTFRIAGQDVNLDENYASGYWSYIDYWAENYWGSHWRNIQLIDADYVIQNDGAKAVINTVTFRVETAVGAYYDVKVKVNRSVNAD